MASIEKRRRKSNKYIPNWMLIKSSKEKEKKIKTETISRKKIGITLYFYSRGASFKCILEEEQRVVWREFFSLRQVKRSFQAKFSFSLVQPKPNIWADLAIKIPHAFGGTVLLTHLLDGVCVCSKK